VGGLFYLGVEVIAPKMQEIISSDNSKEDNEVVEKTLEEEIRERDIIIVNKTIDELKKVLLNPESLQVNEVIIHRYQYDAEREYNFEKDGDTATVYMDYSGMNKMGGYTRKYAQATFGEGKLGGALLDTNYEFNYKGIKKDISEGDPLLHYFDLDLLE